MALDCAGFHSVKPDAGGNKRDHRRRARHSAVLGFAAGGLPHQLCSSLREEAGDAATVRGRAASISHPGRAAANGFANKVFTARASFALPGGPVWHGAGFSWGAGQEPAGGGSPDGVLPVFVSW